MNILKNNIIPTKFLNTVIKYKIGELNKDFDNTFSIAASNAYDFIYKLKPKNFKYIINQYLKTDNNNLKKIANNIFLKNKTNLTIITNKDVNISKLKFYLNKLS